MSNPIYPKKTVDEWLNLVDYEFAGYMPTDAALMFVDFVKKVSGENGEENKTPLFHLVMMDRVFNKDHRCAIMVFRGAAKCLDINSRIATPNGDKLLRDIEVGDIIYDRNLQETKVTHCSPIYEDKKCYKIELKDSSTFICSNDHKHFIVNFYEGKRIERVLTTDELLKEIDKKSLYIPHRSLDLVKIKSISEVYSIPTKCISVDSPTHSYIFNDGYITHNTTLFSEMLILFIAAFGYLPNFGKVTFIMYVSDSIENGVKNLRRNIEYRYENSEFLQAMIPNRKIGVGTNGMNYVSLDEYEKAVNAGRKFTDIRLEFINNRGDRLVVRGYGMSTGVRGAKEMGQRPQLGILDDVISDDDAKSPTVIDNVENTIYKAVSKALDPKHQKIIWTGTPFNANDPLYKAVESGAWRVSVFPVCERFPVSKEEFKGAWEDRFNYEYINREYNEAVLVGKPENFNQELMLRISSIEDRLVRDDEIVWFDRSDVLKNRYNFNYYITTDFATSSKDSADYSVISVWAVSSKLDFLLVDGFCEKVDPSEFLDKVFHYSQMYNPMGVGLEISGQQKTIISWIRKEMIRRNIYFNFLSSNNNGDEGIRPVGDKFSRFNLIVPRFRQKKIWIAKEMKDSNWGREFEDEISKAMKKGFKSRHDDVLDTISMLSSFEAYAPTSRSTEEVESPFYEEELTSFRNTIF